MKLSACTNSTSSCWAPYYPPQRVYLCWYGLVLVQWISQALPFMESPIHVYITHRMYIDFTDASFLFQSQAQVGEGSSIQSLAHYHPVPGPSSMYGNKLIIVLMYNVHANVHVHVHTHTHIHANIHTCAHTLIHRLVCYMLIFLFVLLITMIVNYMSRTHTQATQSLLQVNQVDCKHCQTYLKGLSLQLSILITSPTQ